MRQIKIYLQNRLTDLENKLVVTRGGGSGGGKVGGGIVREFRTDMYILLYLE